MSDPALIEYSFVAMGGPCRLLLADVSAVDSEAIRNRVIAEVERLENRYSRYRPDSLISTINRAAGAATPTEIDAETAGLLQYIDTLWRESGGVFDPTSGILRRAWDFKAGKTPEQDVLDALLPRIGWEQVRWDQESVELTRSGMELDFGGLVKEYAVDSVLRLLTEAGVESALFDMAGDLYAMGRPPGCKGWQVGIRHPRAEGALSTLDLTDIALASSGDYERFIDTGSQRFSHFLNPQTGWPVDGLLCASVLSRQCLVAGSTATVALLKPASEGLAWLAQLGLPWLAVDAGLEVHGPLGKPPA